MITSQEAILFLRILAAHIVADFFLQRTKWIAGKKEGVRSVYLYYHAGVVGVLTYLFLGRWTQWQLPLFIMVTHFLIDAWKSSKGDTFRYFVIDQLLHFIMLVIGWSWLVGMAPAVFQKIQAGAGNITVWVIVCSYLFVLRPAGFFIDKVISRWSDALDAVSESFSGLQNAGTWIGYLERLIILTFILFGHYGAIGFLIAAKSIFRFNGKVQTERDRKLTEYLLVGTLLSFALAIFAGMISRAILY